MQLKYRLPLVILATAAFALSSLHAQEDDEDEEEFGTFGFYGKSPQKINVSLQLTQAAQVQFGNLGNMPTTLTLPADGAVGRLYHDGAIGQDERRPYAPNDPTSEFSSDGVAISPLGGRYQVYSATDRTKVTGDYLSYNPGKTRYWKYNNKSQATSDPGFVAFNIYSARTQGESLSGSRGYTGGVQLALARNLTAPGKRVSFSLVAGVSLTGINSSKVGAVNSTLHVFTDLYSLNGNPAPETPLNADGSSPTPGVIYTGPSFHTDNGKETETTVTLSDLPEDNEETDIADGAHVNGLWKLKGAYLTLKVGPQVTAMFTRKLGMSAGFGVAGSYVGTTYSATESFSVDGVAKPISTDEESSTKSIFLSGYYANIDANWELNDRTGLFAGVSYDNLGNYNQSVGGRTAKVDLGSTAGVRGGLSIKF